MPARCTCSRIRAAWGQQAYIKASNTEAFDFFGVSVALGADGEDSLAFGVGGDVSGDQLNNFASHSGAVYVFTRAGSAWSQQAYVKASNTRTGDAFGISVALAADGNTLAVGAGGEDSVATGVGGDPLDDTATDAGAVYLY